MKLRLFISSALCAGFALVLTAPEAQAVISVPIPADADPAPPPIPILPAAGEAAPPADAIADPVTPEAACGDWYLQSNYGDRWPAGSSWWEYRCDYVNYQYHNTCPGPICNAWCPDCWGETWESTDYFYWDGARAVFYGEAYTYSYQFNYEDASGIPPHVASHAWWDAPT